jgi:hypothetical protein
MDELADWRFSEFQHEANVRNGIRSGLCLIGHSWPVADNEAMKLVEEGLRKIGAERPSWAGGQWHYTTPRENCTWCSRLIEDDRWGRSRFCSSACAKSALLHRAFGDQRESEAIRLAAYRMITKEKAPLASASSAAPSFRADARPNTVRRAVSAVPRATSLRTRTASSAERGSILSAPRSCAAR